MYPQYQRHANRGGSKKMGKGKGKRSQQQVTNDRWENKNEDGRIMDEKHYQNRIEKIKSNPIQPLNQQQSEYLFNLRNKPFNIATGFSGSSKTYLATRVAIEQYLKGIVDKIVIVRPAVSSSKSLGFFGGDKIEKVRNWIIPVLDVLEEFLGKPLVDYMIAKGQIEGVPLEIIKGRSFKNSFIIVDEAEDLTKDEVKKVITRLGNFSTMVLAGDVRQVDIKASGLKFAVEELACKERLRELWGVVDFDDYDEIVRSDAVKATIIELSEMGEM